MCPFNFSHIKKIHFGEKYSPKMDFFYTQIRLFIIKFVRCSLFAVRCSLFAVRFRTQIYGFSKTYANF